MAPAPSTVEVHDSARRTWRVEARRDPRRGRFLVLRPARGDNEPFRAAADGFRPDAYLPIAPEDWDLLARLAAAAGAPADEALRHEAFRRVDRMVVEAQHRGLMGAAEDEDDEDDGATTPTPGPAGTVTAWLAEDHRRLDALLAEAIATPGELHRPAFDAFRAGLLRHIAIEEKILLPSAREARGGEPLPEARRLRIDHGALAALLVPTPTPELVGELRTILEPHNGVEEGPDGVYARCEALLAPRAEELAARIRDYPPVKVARYVDGPRVVRTAAEALRLSGMQAGPPA